MKKSVIINNEGYSEELHFYKDKNKELEGRVDNHIRVNKDLKERL
jgi:hypothetical protein